MIFFQLLSSAGGNRLVDPRGREVPERPVWAAEGRQDLRGQEEGAGEHDHVANDAHDDETNDDFLMLDHLLLTSNVQVLFLKEFCQFSQTLQPQSRESFYKTLSNLGVLPGNFILGFY